MNYSHRGVEHCPVVPDGCKLYDEDAARGDVVKWARWIRKQYSNADEAWLMRGAANAESASGGVLWHRWPAVWAKSIVEPTSLPSNDSWQATFHYVDANRDGEVSQEEFTTAYNLEPLVRDHTTVDKKPRDVELGQAGEEVISTTDLPVKLSDADTAGETAGGSSGYWLLAWRNYILAIFAASIAVAVSVCFLCPRWRGRRRKKTRTARLVQSRSEEESSAVDDTDASDVLEPTEKVAMAADLLNDREAPIATALKDSSATQKSIDFPGNPMPVPSFLGWQLPRVMPGNFSNGLGFWRTDSFRYGPLATAEDHARAVPTWNGGGRAYSQYTSSAESHQSLDGSCRSMPSRISFHGQDALSQSRMSMPSYQAGTIEVDAQPKMHYVERSQSFCSAAGQAPPTLTVVERVHSFTKLHGSNGSFAHSEPREPIAQTPWAAVFTPQEWIRATKDMAQPPQSPGAVFVPVEVVDESELLA